MKKRMLASALALGLLLSLLAGCEPAAADPAPAEAETSAAAGAAEPSDAGAPESSGEDLAFHKFDSPVDVHIGMSVSPTDTTLPEGDSAQDNQYTRYLRDNYNINVIVDWTAAMGNDYKQKVSLAIASDTLPDGLIANDQSYMLKAAKSDMLYDITDLYQKYASTQVKGILDSSGGLAMENASYEGRMVALPDVKSEADGAHILIVRKDWLDQYELPIPKTVDDVEAVARAFKEQKPAGDQTIPIAGPSKSEFLYATFLLPANNSHGFDPIFQAYDVYPGYYIDNGDGSVSYGSVDAKMKPALERLAAWYQEGLIDPEMATRDNTNEVVFANQVGMFFAPWWVIGYGNLDSFKNDPTANWQAYPIYDDAGKWNVHMNGVSLEYCLISKNASEDTAAAIIIMNNALLRDESTFDTSVAIGWYPLRTVLAASDECEYEHKEIMKVLRGEAEPEDYNDPLSIYKLLYQDVLKAKTVVPGFEDGRDLNVADFSMDNQGDFQRLYSLLVGDRPLATVPVDKAVYSATYSQTETMERYWANLKKMEDEVMLKIVIGQSDISAFDTFVTDWHAQGGQEILDEIQAGLS